MEKTINFLEKPKINVENLNYIDKNPIQIYVNLYKISIKKELKLYQYPFALDHEPKENYEKSMKYLLSNCHRILKSMFKNFFISGKSLYSAEQIKEIKNVKSYLYSQKKREEFIFEFQQGTNMKIIKQEDVQRDPLAKQYIELIIRDILHSNTKLEFFKDIFVMTDEKISIDIQGVAVDFYPGFATSFVETDKGNFLNVTLKHKIIQKKTVLDFLNENDYKKKSNKEYIKEKLKNALFKDSYLGKNYKITDIDFDRNPMNTSFLYKGKSAKIFDYYKEKYNITIKNKDQPLILVCKGPIEEDKSKLYFVPELVSLLGLEDDQIKQFNFMSELAKSTKLTPEKRVMKTKKFIELLKDTKKKKDDQLSPKEKLDLYGITIEPIEENVKQFKGYYMKSIDLYDANDNKIKGNTFQVVKKVDLLKKKWYFVYEEDKEVKKGKKKITINYDNASKLYESLCSASKAFKIKVEEPEWISVPYNSSYEDWTKSVEENINLKSDKPGFVLFLINDETLYPDLKWHSLCEKGYISQVVKSSTINKKGLMSICSKILIQINSKMGGIPYKIKFDKAINERKLIAIGVDSSHVPGKRTGVGMVATIDKNFSSFFNKEQIIEEKNKKELQFCISSFIEKSIQQYKNHNKEDPKGIIIYRQGVSLQQKEFLKDEIKQIDLVCQTKKVLYYYILVNTKTNYKIFHIEDGQYFNPYSGLLVLDGITNRNFFEFYIQPQEVTEGSSTPSCFHVAYGNLNFPEIIPKFTFDLCHIYSNWKGAVRIPNVLKAAEKLSKMTAKYTQEELNTKLQLGQSYL
jgi:aubergine-like protein